jgi:hypothetical protein
MLTRDDGLQFTAPAIARQVARFASMLSSSLRWLPAAGMRVLAVAIPTSAFDNDAMAVREPLEHVSAAGVSLRC